MKPAVGGQAVPGGVALRNGERMAVAVRTPDGRVTSTSWQIPSSPALSKIWGVRGLVALLLAMSAGVRAMTWARRQTRPVAPTHAAGRVARSTPVVGLLSITFVAPTLLERATPAIPALAAGLVNSWGQVLVFVATLALLARVPHVRTLLANHGAEHKVVAVHETGGAPSVATAQEASRFHARCGTSFAALLVISGAVAYPLATLLPWGSLWTGTVVTLALIGLTFEVQRAAAARLESSRTARLLLTPGVWLQHITTVEPTDAQVEVAIEALHLALAPMSEPTAPVLAVA